MNIIDTNGIIHVLKNNLTPSEVYYLAPDIVEEADFAEVVQGKKVPSNICSISETGYFDQSIYLNYYNKILNKYGGRSFYNMTGFGDVSIISTLHTAIKVFENPVQGRLFDISEPITVFTDDGPLTNKILAEFPGKNVVIKSVSDIT